MLKRTRKSRHHLPCLFRPSWPIPRQGRARNRRYPCPKPAHQYRRNPYSTGGSKAKTKAVSVVQSQPAPGDAAVSTPVPQNTGSQFSLSLDAMGQALISSPWITSPYYGAGGQVFADWRPIQYLSFGAGAEYAYFFGTPTFKLSSFDLGGRIFPLPLEENPSVGNFTSRAAWALNLLVLHSRLRAFPHTVTRAWATANSWEPTWPWTWGPSMISIPPSRPLPTARRPRSA